MQLDEMDSLDFDPLDPTKVWPEDRFPLMEVGTMTLNRNPKNFFAEVEQVAFSPSATVNGIEPSEDKLLQGRLFSYPDTQRYRLGANYLQIPVNCPYAPVHNQQRDGAMQINQNPSTINYEPSRHAENPVEDPAYRDSTMKVEGYVSREKIDKPNDFKQAGERYRSFSKEEQDNLIANLTNDLKDVNERTKLLAVCNFFRADQEYGMRLAQALNVDITQYVGNARNKLEKTTVMKRSSFLFM